MKKPQHNKGFTLLEMLVVLGIFAVMTSITVFNYTKFRTETILTNMAYEVALSIREAQIYGVSVRSPNGQSSTSDFQYPYGVNFVEDSNTYYLFVDSQNIDGVTDCPGSAECVTPYTLQRGILISALQKECLDQNELNVTFRRPNPEAIFDNNSDVSDAQVELTSPDGDTRYVVIRNNGQIEVKRESICP